MQVSVDSRIKMFTVKRVLKQVCEQSNVVHGLLHDPARHTQGEKIREFFDNVPELLRKCVMAIAEVELELNDMITPDHQSSDRVEAMEIMLDSMTFDEADRLLVIPGVDE